LRRNLRLAAVLSNTRVGTVSRETASGEAPGTSLPVFHGRWESGGLDFVI